MIKLALNEQEQIDVSDGFRHYVKARLTPDNIAGIMALYHGGGDMVKLTHGKWSAHADVHKVKCDKHGDLIALVSITG